MSNRVVVSVATTPQYQVGLDRLVGEVERQGLATMHAIRKLMPGWPTHEEKPYAFKAYALELAADAGYDTLLWCDACMWPAQDMEPLFHKIERDGYWFSRNGWNNYEWTADSAYPDLFPEVWKRGETSTKACWDEMRAHNRNIPHVVATCFGLSMKSREGRGFLREYIRLARDTRAFCGPWKNCATDIPANLQNARQAVCGPADVRGHRHDQTAASVIAYRLGMVLTDPPEYFSYGKKGEQFDPRTIMIADGAY